MRFQRITGRKCLSYHSALAFVLLQDGLLLRSAEGRSKIKGFNEGEFP
jgi:hypothetical protein